MATAAMPLSGPPQPPAVSNQTGQTDPTQAIGAMAASSAGQSQGQSPNGPNAQLVAQLSAVTQIITQMQQASQLFAPFGDKAIQLLQAGVAQASSPSDQSAPGSVSAGTQPSGNGTAPFPG